MLSLFQFTDYRKYLADQLNERGRKKELCDFIPCQTTFFSNVMAGTANLSLEHAIRTSEFLNLSEKESPYFMLIVQYGKAGSKQLESYYLKQIEAIQKEQEKISSKIATHETIPLEEQLIFYNSWLYVAIHILCAVEATQSRPAISKYLNLSRKDLDPVFDFMIRNGIITEKEGKLKQGTTRVHLPKGSPFLNKHHTNWRLKAIQSLDQEKENDLHYTMVLSLSGKDVATMKQIIFESITKTDQLLKKTGDEVVYSFCLDWFKLT